MIRYIVKRILLFIPTLFIISLFTFWLSKVAPGDPVIACYGSPGEDTEITGETYADIYQRMGLDKPLFYFGVNSADYPDTLYKITGRYRQIALSKLVSQYGDWPSVESYYHSLQSFSEKLAAPPGAINRDTLIALRSAKTRLLEAYEKNVIESHLSTIKKHGILTTDSLQKAYFEKASLKLVEDYSTLTSKKPTAKSYLPALHFNGFDNQYHNWLTNFLKGDFGTSCQSKRPVIDRLKVPMFWTLIINLMVIVLVYLLSVPLGIFSAVQKNTWKDRIISVTLFLLYSLPTFWIGTMLLVFFTNPEYGMDWFEGAGLGKLPSDAPFWDRFWETFRHLILPVFCLTYGSLAFLTRQMRGSMLDVLNQDFIRTAKAKGLSSRKIIWRHAFRNALFPLITIFATLFPAAVAGSVIIEMIFNIPGMGRELIRSIYSKDWPVLYTILMLVAILTMIGNLVADILYAWADPRVRFR